MKKIILLTGIVFLNLILITGCSSNAPIDTPSVVKPQAKESSDSLTDSQKDNVSTDSKVPKPSDSGNDNKSDLPYTSNSNTSSDNNTSQEGSKTRTTEGYVLEMDGDIIYLDLENTGGRNYPREGEDRKVAFNIANAKQIQTNPSEFDFSRENFIRPGINIKIEYYVKNGVNIATEIISNGDELEPITYVSIGYLTYISDSKITLTITDGENSGKTIDFNLSECDSSKESVSLNDLVIVTYYFKQGINFATNLTISS